MPLSGEELRRRRLEAGLSEYDLVEMTGFTVATIRTIEITRDLPPVIFKLIANAIDECAVSKAENVTPVQTVKGQSTVDKVRVREQHDTFPETLEDIDTLGLLALKLIRNDC